MCDALLHHSFGFREGLALCRIGVGRIFARLAVAINAPTKAADAQIIHVPGDIDLKRVRFDHT